MLISIINKELIHEKVLQGNRVSMQFEVDTLAELCYIATTENIVLATFTNNIKESNCFIQSPCIAFDYDDAEATIEELDDCLQGINYAILTTQSHLKWKKDREPCARFRLIVPIQEQCLNIQSHQATYDALYSIIIPPNDKCTRNPVQYLATHKEVIAFENNRTNFKTIHTRYIKPQETEIGNIGEYQDIILDCLRSSDLYKECSNMLKTPGLRNNGTVKLSFFLKRNGIELVKAILEVEKLLIGDMNHHRKVVKQIYGEKNENSSR